jgi:methyltransferase (TIGR00027 family)
MLDAELNQPVCGDSYAQLFMSDEGMEILEPFRDMLYANALNVARPRIIDDLIRQQLLADPDLQVVLIGAGFDSRAYRMPGGKWIELDEPALISFKNSRLAAHECKNTLHRIAIDFQTESLEEKLSSFASSQPVVVVIEGVFMYLNQQQTEAVIHTLAKLFPNHKLICELMNLGFFKKYAQSTHRKFETIGACFSQLEVEPEQLFANNDYQISEQASIADKAKEYGALNIPRILLNFLMPTFRSGYCVYVFEKLKRIG